MVSEQGTSVLVGVDCTGERVRILLADVHGQRVMDGEWPLPPLEDDEAWAWEIGGRIATLFAGDGARRSALAVVVAAPGSVDPSTGRLLQSTGQPAWDGLGIADALRRHLGAPVAAENRTIAALLGETWPHPQYEAAAAGLSDVLYVSLRGVPSAAVLSGGRPVRGAHFEAGALPAVPPSTPGRPLSPTDLERVAGVLADVAALVDPETLVLDGDASDLERMRPLLQRVLDEVAPGPQVVNSTLGDGAAVIGAVRMARALAFEGERKA